MAAIICTYNSERHIVTCLESLKAQECISEVVIVDNASEDLTVQMVRAWASRGNLPVRLVENPENLGYAKAMNRGACLAGADQLLILNPDTRLEQGAVALLAQRLAVPDIAVVGPNLVLADGTRDHAGARRAPTFGAALAHLTPLARRRSSYRDKHPSTTVEAISGACFLIRRSTFTRLGGFDERFWMYGEDLDLCLRARREHGQIAFEGDAVVWHYKGGSNPESGRRRSPKAAYEFYNALGLYWKKHAPVSWPGPARESVLFAARACGLIAALRSALARRRHTQFAGRKVGSVKAGL